jgi:Mor family transcriptional regulator
LSDIIGIENVIKLIENLGGTNFYIPKYSKLDKFVKRFLIINKGASNKKICLDLNVSEQYIRNFKKKFL